MIDFKKMEDKNFIIINKSVSDKEEKEFSEFLTSRKAKAKQTRDKKKVKTLYNEMGQLPN